MLTGLLPICLICMCLTLLITVLTERRLVPYLRSRAAQPIYSEGPSWHLSKSGTPTMGGIAFVIAVTVILILAALICGAASETDTAYSLLIAALFSLGNSAIGLIDDLTKLRRKKNGGLTPVQKLAMQALLATLFLWARAALTSDGTTLVFSFGALELGFLYYPLCVIILLGIVNCANLTDGVDGLAASVAFAFGTCVILYTVNVDASIIALCMIGGAIGFLCFNLHPARIFMGDTGSLFFGALAASCGFCIGNPTTVVPIGIVYVIEGVSVILQVAVYKLCKRRVFKMAPLHHHLERSGIEESVICIIAILTTVAAALICSPLFL